MNVSSKLEVELELEALPVPELIGYTKLGRSLAMPTQGGRRGSEVVSFERAFVSSYRPSIDVDSSIKIIVIRTT